MLPPTSFFCQHSNEGGWLGPEPAQRAKPPESQAQGTGGSARLTSGSGPSHPFWLESVGDLAL